MIYLIFKIFIPLHISILFIAKVHQQIMIGVPAVARAPHSDKPCYNVFTVFAIYKLLNNHYYYYYFLLYV